MEIISNTSLISINETLIIQVLSFLVFLFIINRLMFRPLRNAMSEREHYFEEMSQEIEAAKKEVVRYSAEIENRGNAVKDEAYAISKELEETGKNEAKQIVDAAMNEIFILREKTGKEIDTQISEAKRYVQKESEDLAVNIVEKILDRRLFNETVQ